MFQSFSLMLQAYNNDLLSITVKVLLFAGYQFSWFLLAGQTTKFGSQQKGGSIDAYT